MPPSTDMAQFRTVVRKSKHIVVVAGAGLSAASGIPTFRGAGGFWRTHKATQLGTPQAFEDNPSLVWQFYHYRRTKALAAQPNAAHRVLARLSQPSFLHSIAPKAKSFHLITQNVDRLSVRALEELGLPLSSPDPLKTGTPASRFAARTRSGSKKEQETSGFVETDLIEIHGRLFDVLCSSLSCGHVEHNLSNPLTPALGALPDTLPPTSMEDYIAIPVEDLPRCAECGSLARPGVVWFGEIPWRLEEIEELVERADLCLVVGTSSTVYPAAGYAEQVAEHGGKVAVFNLDTSSGDQDADFLFRGPCEVLLGQALGVEA